VVQLSGNFLLNAEEDREDSVITKGKDIEKKYSWAKMTLNHPVLIPVVGKTPRESEKESEDPGESGNIERRGIRGRKSG